MLCPVRILPVKLSNGLTVRVVIASVETYLKYAEAIGLTASAAAPA